MLTSTSPAIDTLIAQSAADAGLPVETARTALAGALGLLDKHAAQAPLDDLYAAVPGAQDLARTPEAKPKSGGLLGGVMKSAGGVSGAAMADAMGLLGRLKKLGLDKDELKPLVKAARARVTAATGRDLLGDVVKSVPGVGPLIGG